MFQFDNSFKSFLTKYKTTAFLIFVVLMFGILTLIFYGSYNNYSITKMGGLTGNNDVIVWRLFTYAFGHLSILHLLINIPSIYLFGRPLERLYGSKVFLILTILFSVFTGLIITFFHHGIFPLSGSSSFISSYLGIFTYYLFTKKSMFYQQDRNILYIIILSFLFTTFLIPEISIAGHLGGFIVGLIFSVFLDKIVNIKSFYLDE